jgi:2-polyprenyl-3-methyl-5-hydroxy-6-metoxy-1,4-benzoquinol methylase
MSIRKGEPQNVASTAKMRERGPEIFGHGAGYTWHDDPRRLVFMLSRYKFVAKMLAGLDHVLEIGCGDGFGTRIVAQAVKRVTGIDFDPDYIESAVATMNPRWPADFYWHDVLEAPVQGNFDAVFALDVLEHIDKSQEERFLRHALHGLLPNGVCIIGMPSLESQPYASAGARMGHVNCKEQPDLKALMQRYFHNVFMFSANDEVVHTGFSKMSHYNIALCCGRRLGT